MVKAKGLITAGDDVTAQSVLAEHIATPLMILRESALEANIKLMMDYCHQHNVFLAPHAKTTMSPEIVERQRAAGAWAITVANVSQAISLEHHAGTRILIANEVVDSASIAWLNSVVKNGETDVYCYVDSIAGARRLAAGITGDGVLDVFLEVGMAGGRAGVRTPGQAADVVHELQALPSLRLAGVAAFEGLIGGNPRTADKKKSVREYLHGVHQIAAELADAGAFNQIDEPILTAGGSAYFDLVADELTRPISGSSTKVILRSGCYVTHDHGAYANASPFHPPGPTFSPAIEVLSSVLSRPEPDLAICDIGRRDVPFDAGLPVALWIYRGETGETEALSGVETLRLNDQHAYLGIGESTVNVGDIISFGIAHPCTAFDKWRVIPLVDDDLKILRLFHTRF